LPAQIRKAKRVMRLLTIQNLVENLLGHSVPRGYTPPPSAPLSIRPVNWREGMVRRRKGLKLARGRKLRKPDGYI
jgi:hypothetical protein